MDSNAYWLSPGDLLCFGGGSGFLFSELGQDVLGLGTPSTWTLPLPENSLLCKAFFPLLAHSPRERSFPIDTMPESLTTFKILDDHHASNIQLHKILRFSFSSHGKLGKTKWEDLLCLQIFPRQCLPVSQPLEAVPEPAVNGVQAN